MKRQSKRQATVHSIILGLLFSLPVFADFDGKTDWRRQHSPANKVANLVKVIPGAADIMIVVGERYKNLYWAARQGKWEFAIYQAEEIEGLIKKLRISRPKRAASATEFLGKTYPAITKAVQSRNWVQFERAFNSMRRSCMTCHKKNNHAYITLQIPERASSPVLNKY